ncbi:hypothetical protein PSTG_08908 [Puccinia striiformis f. sp. tritici PST-78]|uniref:Uncharacterized protein n=1 Tax=Puccinia striiformis f. sp. tritici PST-78 TaxID=1165861 RepID=A0A0L0VFA2_9BASI|nr:hypothetical protein PSTG_08908 [Puccinia striiformis f. sp. tritici PST-78]
MTSPVKEPSTSENSTSISSSFKTPTLNSPSLTDAESQIVTKNSMRNQPTSDQSTSCLASTLRRASAGDITPGLVLPRLSEITQVIFRFLGPDEAKISNKEAQKKITILLTGRIAHIQLQTCSVVAHRCLHPPLQKKISQWTLINQKLKELKAHDPDYRMAFSKAVIVRDNKLFGTGTVLADIAEHHIILPSDKEVQAQLPLITSSQHQPNPSA